MAVSRRLRYEILRRDGYTCRYCGAKAPDASLTVDHVIPITLGGDDDPRNLVTACADCNAGKSSMPADSPVVDDVDATAMLFAGAIERIAQQRRADRATMEAVIDEFDEHWCHWEYVPDGGVVVRDDGWRNSIEQFIGQGLNLDDLKHYANIAMQARTRGGVWKYFCGCCWRELSSRQELARRLIEDGDV